jgi:1-acyl-sn-glycerol-3-phosphate acyltransferase
MLKALARALLGLFGWSVIEPPERPTHAVIVGFPHTSNWDGVLALLTKVALGLPANWVGKDTLFCGPIGGIMRWLGGIPIDRSAPQGFVAQMAAEFTSRPNFLLVMAPEGTRSLTKGWKSGFYRIAREANVPVALAFVDYARREAGILAYLSMTGDPAVDIAAIAAHYEGRAGKHPELASPIRWLN